MIMQEYKDLSRVFKKENFKRQIVISCLLSCTFFLCMGLTLFFKIFNGIIFLLLMVGVCISYLVAGYLEKKGIFIDRKYFQHNMYRSIYVICLILIWLICKGILHQERLTLYIFLMILMEMFASYMEYRLFLKKMDYFKSLDMELDDSNFL
jgi:hypothetical protein